ncbi:MAG: hypothetical protein ACT4OS_07680 [Acidimicrobiales bacterium]
MVGFAMASTAVVLVDGEPFEASEESALVFGRADGDGVVGLDGDDMGISAVAGSIESNWGVWWVINQSQKRPLQLSAAGGATRITLAPGRRQAIVSERLDVFVRGAIFEHHLEVLMDDAYVAGLTASSARLTSGTITDTPIELSTRERLALTALFSGYLESFPRRNDQPLTYSRAAARLGGTWTPDAVRKAAERVKVRFATRAQIYFQGLRANDEMAAHLVSSGMLTGEDLQRLPAAGR